MRGQHYSIPAGKSKVPQGETGSKEEIMERKDKLAKPGEKWQGPLETSQVSE